jgi:hypothetical protein
MTKGRTLFGSTALGVLDPGNEASEAREIVRRNDVRVFKNIVVDGGVSCWRQFLEKRMG